MDFIAVDVETANPNFASICQIGVVSFCDGQVADCWQTLIDPEDYFDFMNILVHGITEEKVRGAPTFPEIDGRLKRLLAQRIVVTHTAFDRVSLNRVAERYQLPAIECNWLDSARVARRAWEKFRYDGYGLLNLAQEFGIKFEHHNAAEDARAAGEVLLRAITDTGITLQDWLVRAYRPIQTKAKVTQEGNPDGPLAGEVIVFTGALSMPRRQVAELAANAGCDVADNVSKKTTLLIVGDQDIRKLAGHDKSSKHRKAEELIGKGQPIRILGESDFVRFADQA